MRIFLKKNNPSINWQRVSSLIFYLFIFLLPWQTIFIIKENFIDGEKFQYTTIGIYLFEIVLMAWVAIHLIKQKQFFYKKNILNDLILLFLLWSTLSILWSGNKYLSVFFSLQILLGVVLFFLIQSLAINKNKAIGVLLVSSFLQGTLGIFQFVTQSTFSNKWLGISTHLASQGGSSVLENITGRWLRGYGGMPHPNILGGFLAVSLILGILFYIKIKNKDHYLKIIALIMLSVNFLALLFTFSRSAWLGLFLALFLILIYSFYKKQKTFFLKTFSFSLIFTAFFLIFSVGYFELILPRFSSESRLEKKSINERIEFLKQSKEIIKTNPIVGVGIGNYTNYLHENNSSNIPVWKLQPTHNTFMLIFAELGIIGISLFAGIIVFALKNIKKDFEKNKTEKIFFLSSLVILFIALIFDHWLWTTSSGIILFWLLLGLYKKEI